MEILHALNTNEWSTEHSCGACDSKLKIKKTDLIYSCRVATYIEDSDDHYYHVRCPVCDNLSYVQHSDIPKRVQIKVKEDNKSSKIKIKKSWFRKFIETI